MGSEVQNISIVSFRRWEMQRIRSKQCSGGVQLPPVQQEDFVILHKHDDIINMEGELAILWMSELELNSSG